MIQMLRSCKGDKPQITLLFTQFPLTITVIDVFKSALISDYFKKLDLKPTPSPNVLAFNISGVHHEETDYHKSGNSIYNTPQ